MQKLNREHSPGRRRLLLLLGVASLSLALPGMRGAEAAAADLESYIRQCADSVIAAANTGSADRFRSVIRRHADIPQLAGFALGSYAGDLPRSQQREYYSLFESWIASTLSAHSQQLRGTRYEVTGTSGGPGTYVVSGRVLGARSMRVAFRVGNDGGRYRVRDVNVGGIWLSGQMRTMIVNQLRRNRGDFGALFSYLRR